MTPGLCDSSGKIGYGSEHKTLADCPALQQAALLELEQVRSSGLIDDAVTRLV